MKSLSLWISLFIIYTLSLPLRGMEHSTTNSDYHYLGKYKLNLLAQNRRLCSCSKRFNTLPELENHIKSCHLEHLILDKQRKTYHACSACPEKFSILDELLIHYPEHTTEPLYTCLECKMDFIELSQAKHHIELHKERDNSYHALFDSSPLEELEYSSYNNLGSEIARDPSIFSGENSLGNYLLSSLISNLRKCSCKQRFNTLTEIIDHIKNNHLRKLTLDKEVKMYHKCRECKDGFSSLAALLAHFPKHTKEILYTCIECQLHFTSLSKAKIHIQTYHAPRMQITSSQSNNASTIGEEEEEKVFRLISESDTTDDDEENEGSHPRLTPQDTRSNKRQRTEDPSSYNITEQDKTNYRLLDFVNNLTATTQSQSRHDSIECPFCEAEMLRGSLIRHLANLNVCLTCPPGLKVLLQDLRN